MGTKELGVPCELGLQGASFIVDTISSSQKDEEIVAPILEAIYKKEFASFDELRIKLKSLGFDMSTPSRTEEHGVTRVSCAVFNDQGEEVCRLTLEANIDLSNAPPGRRRKLLLK